MNEEKQFDNEVYGQENLEALSNQAEMEAKVENEINSEKKVEVIKEQKIEKDPNYFYWLDKDGNVCRKLRGNTPGKPKKKKTIINFFDKVSLSVPKVLINGYVSKKFKTVRRTGPAGGMIWVPPELVGKTFQVILIPKEDWIVSQIKI